MSYGAPEEVFRGDVLADHGAAPPPPLGGSIPMATTREALHGEPQHAAAVSYVAAPNHEVPDVEALLVEAIEVIETARPAPLSTSPSSSNTRSPMSSVVR